MSQNTIEFEKLLEVLNALLAPDGCEWDNTQTSKSLTPYNLPSVDKRFSKFGALSPNCKVYDINVFSELLLELS